MEGVGTRDEIERMVPSEHVAFSGGGGGYGEDREGRDRMWELGIGVREWGKSEAKK